MSEPLTGQLLVASSLVTEPIYSGGVCLIVHEDVDHVIGVMLNRPMKPDPKALTALLEHSGLESSGMGHNPPEPMPQRLDDRASLPQDAPSPADDSVLVPPQNELSNSAQQGISLGLLKALHFGGPHSGPVVAIHQDAQCAEAEMGTGIFVAAQRQHLEKLVQDRETPLRLIVGHIHWDRAQLAQERAAGVWHSVPATRQSVFSQSTEMWPNLIRRATSRSLAQWIGTPDVVGAAELN